MTSSTSENPIPNKNHHLFDSIFLETHTELLNIQDQMKELRLVYQSNESSDILIPYEGESLLVGPIIIEPIPELKTESVVDEPTLNKDQINKFKQIYLKNKIEDPDDELTFITKKLNQKDKAAQRKKLQITICCKEKCLQNLVHHENALTYYQNFQNIMNNNQKDMFLLEILSATTQNEMITTNQKCQKLASNYIFEGIKICNVAFLIIYGIGEKYWRNLQNHYSENGIIPRVHKLTGKVSNSTLSFDKVLEILTFIVNYSNIHGLPSPGIYNNLILF